MSLVRSILKNRFVYLCSGNTLRQLEVNLKIVIITCNHFLTSFAVIHLFIWSNNFMIVSGGSLIDHVPIITCYRTVIIPTVPHNLRFPRTITTATTTSNQIRENVPSLQDMLFTKYLIKPTQAVSSYLRNHCYFRSKYCQNHRKIIYSFWSISTCACRMTVKYAKVSSH